MFLYRVFFFLFFLLWTGIALWTYSRPEIYFHSFLLFIFNGLIPTLIALCSLVSIFFSRKFQSVFFLIFFHGLFLLYCFEAGYPYFKLRNREEDDLLKLAQKFNPNFDYRTLEEFTIIYNKAGKRIESNVSPQLWVHGPWPNKKI